MACKATEKVVIAGGREVVALGSWQRCSGDSLVEEAVQLEDEAIFQLKLATGMGFQYPLAMWWSLCLSCMLACFSRALREPGTSCKSEEKSSQASKES